VNSNYIALLRKSIKLINGNSKINNPSFARTSWFCHDLLIAWGALALKLREALCACALQIIIISNKSSDFLPVKTYFQEIKYNLKFLLINLIDYRNMFPSIPFGTQVQTMGDPTYEKAKQPFPERFKLD
jgi:hypothetical protein